MKTNSSQQYVQSDKPKFFGRRKGRTIRKAKSFLLEDFLPEVCLNVDKRIDLSDLLAITTLKGNRNEKYAVFEEMVADGRIGAAVEMYANDTVQYSPDGKLIWVESNDTEVAKYGNKLFQ